MKNKKKLTIIISAAAALIVAAVLFRALDDTPNHKRMAAALADMYLLDAVIDQKGVLGDEKKKTEEALYHTLFEHHGLTKTEFDSALSWYANHPPEYDELYHDVIGRLTEREANFLELFTRYDSITRRVNFLRDSIRHQWWQIPNTIRLPLQKTDTVVDKKLHFVVEKDTIRGGIITLEMKHIYPYRNKAHDTCQMRLVVEYTNHDRDTVEREIIKRIQQQTSTINYHVRDTISASRIEATLLTSKELEQTSGTLSEIQFSYMPYEITDSIQVDEVVFPPLFPY